MKQYLELLDKILTEGVEKESGRPNMPNTIGISNATIRMDLSEGFPLLTTKRMFFKGIIHELLWILRGETNIKYLVDNGVNIWSSDAYRWYQHIMSYIGKEPDFKTIEDFIEAVKNRPEFFREDGKYYLGDLGKVYGYQWRKSIGEKTDDELYENYLKSVKSQDIS